MLCGSVRRMLRGVSTTTRTSTLPMVSESHCKPPNTTEYNDTCTYPTFFLDNGSVIDPKLTGCMASSFDQYGDIEAFGV